jgi:hypothetical protein
MIRILTVITVLTLIDAGFGISSAQAQKPRSCSLEGCIAACNKQGGRTCNLYCQNEMSRRGCTQVR